MHSARFSKIWTEVKNRGEHGIEKFFLVFAHVLCDLWRNCGFLGPRDPQINPSQQDGVNKCCDVEVSVICRSEECPLCLIPSDGITGVSGLHCRILFLQQK